MSLGKKRAEHQAADEYYIVPVIPVDETVHTDEHPFCDDMSCPCHEDPSNVRQLGGYYQDGLVSSADADRIFRGKTF